MLPILLCSPTKSEVDVGDMAVKVESSRQYSVKFCCMGQMTVEGQSDMEVHVKQRCIIEFFHAEKTAPNEAVGGVF